MAAWFAFGEVALARDMLRRQHRRRAYRASGAAKHVSPAAPHNVDVSSTAPYRPLAIVTWLQTNATPSRINPIETARKLLGRYRMIAS